MYKVNKEIAQKIWTKIEETDKIVLCSHVDTDGDTIGASLALKNLILQHFPHKEVKISGEEYPRYLSFLESPEIVEDSFFNNATIIVVDTSTLSRIHDKRAIPKESIKIDHHHKEEEWLLEIGGDHWPSTGQVVYEFARLLELDMNDKVKEGIFVAIWTDTEGLTQRNISNVTHEAIKFVGANIAEDLLTKMKLTEQEEKHIQDMVHHQMVHVDENFAYLITDDVVPNDYLRQAIGRLSNQDGFEVFCGITKTTNGQFAGSLRSKGNVDVSVYARLFGGNGHFSSSGFKLDNIVEGFDCIETLKDKLNN